jgi:hypothetical protein
MTIIAILVLGTLAAIAVRRWRRRRRRRPPAEPAPLDWNRLAADWPEHDVLWARDLLASWLQITPDLLVPEDTMEAIAERFSARGPDVMAGVDAGWRSHSWSREGLASAPGESVGDWVLFIARHSLERARDRQ